LLGNSANAAKLAEDSETKIQVVAHHAFEYQSEPSKQAERQERFTKDRPLMPRKVQSH
jgi:hypothetical protein